MPKQTVSKAKKKAWVAFSAYIRTRDCYLYAKRHPESNGLQAECVTCGRLYPFGKLQAGHFISGRSNAQLFDEIGVNVQCYGCNVMKKGATDEYWVWMENNYGREEIDRLMAQKHETVKLTVQDYLNIESKYKDKKREIMERQ